MSVEDGGAVDLAFAAEVFGDGGHPKAVGLVAAELPAHKVATRDRPRKAGPRGVAPKRWTGLERVRRSLTKPPLAFSNLIGISIPSKLWRRFRL